MDITDNWIFHKVVFRTRFNTIILFSSVYYLILVETFNTLVNVWYLFWKKAKGLKNYCFPLMDQWRRRISLNPAVFLEQERKSRSLSLATYKLSYYPEDVDRKR